MVDVSSNTWWFDSCLKEKLFVYFNSVVTRLLVLLNLNECLLTLVLNLFFNQPLLMNLSTIEVMKAILCYSTKVCGTFIQLFSLLFVLITFRLTICDGLLKRVGFAEEEQEEVVCHFSKP